jgi:PAS domain S-box-containing protein
LELTQELEKRKVQEEKTLDEFHDLKYHHETVVSSIHSGICVVNSQGIVTMFNREAERITGLSAPEVMDRPVARFAVLKPLAAFLARAYTMGQLCSSRETVLISEDGRVIEIGFSTSPLRTRRRTIAGAIATFRDLVEIKQLRDQVQRSEQMAFLGEMASTMAMEILEPLKSINTFAKLQCKSTNSSDRFHQFAEVISNETGRIDEIVSQTLNFTTTNHVVESVDMNEVIQSTVTSLHDKIGDHSMSVTLDLDPYLPLAMGSCLKLQRICSQLILNAAEAINEGGGLRISTHADGDSVVARFADNGPGIPYELRDKIFDPFFTTKGGATGLGLAVAQKLLTDCGGCILLIDGPDEGAVFEVRLTSHAATEQPLEDLAVA